MLNKKEIWNRYEKYLDICELKEIPENDIQSWEDFQDDYYNYLYSIMKEEY